LTNIISRGIRSEEFDIILRRRLSMVKKAISGGIVHKLPKDLREALTSDPKALLLWEDLTPLARNEWICWVTFVKKDETRKEHVKRTVSELKEGMRRPCCWLGCIHRTDKQISPSVQYILSRKRRDTRTG
jgi:bacteriocin resistance YdeI/OmpD-like protein